MQLECTGRITQEQCCEKYAQLSRPRKRILSGRRKGALRRHCTDSNGVDGLAFLESCL